MPPEEPNVAAGAGGGRRSAGPSWTTGGIRFDTSGIKDFTREIRTAAEAVKGLWKPFDDLPNLSRKVDRFFANYKSNLAEAKRLSAGLKMPAPEGGGGGGQGGGRGGSGASWGGGQGNGGAPSPSQQRPQRPNRTPQMVHPAERGFAQARAQWRAGATDETNLPGVPGTGAGVVGAASWGGFAMRAGLALGTVAANSVQKNQASISDMDLLARQAAMQQGQTGRGSYLAQYNAMRYMGPGNFGRADIAQASSYLLGRTGMVPTTQTLGGGGTVLQGAGRMVLADPSMQLADAAQASAGLYGPVAANRLLGLGINVSPGGKPVNQQAVFNQLTRRLFKGNTPNASDIANATRQGTSANAVLTGALGGDQPLIQAYTDHLRAQVALGGGPLPTDTAGYAAAMKRAGIDTTVAASQRRLAEAQGARDMTTDQGVIPVLTKSNDLLASIDQKMADFLQTHQGTADRIGNAQGASYELGRAAKAVGKVAGGALSIGGAWAARRLFGKAADAFKNRGSGGADAADAGTTGADAAGTAATAGTEAATTLGPEAGIATAGFFSDLIPPVGAAVAGYQAVSTMAKYPHGGGPDPMLGLTAETPAEQARNAADEAKPHKKHPWWQFWKDAKVIGDPVGSWPWRYRGGEIGDPTPSSTGSLRGPGRSQGMSSSLLTKLQQMFAANPGLMLTSGFRTRAEQEALYREKPGLAAAPGHSNHERGTAADVSDGSGGSWLTENARKFGLYQPMPTKEPWHLEESGGSSGAAPAADPSAAKDASAGGGTGTATGADPHAKIDIPMSATFGALLGAISLQQHSALQAAASGVTGGQGTQSGASGQGGGTGSAPGQQTGTTAAPVSGGDIPSIILRTGQSMGATKQMLLAAFETGIVESSMRNLNYGDRDSLGVFQQRPSQGWGTKEQVMDVGHAAGEFFKRAAGVHNATTAGQMAQAVQRSAFPARYDGVRAQAAGMLSGLGVDESGVGDAVPMMPSPVSSFPRGQTVGGSRTVTIAKVEINLSLERGTYEETAKVGRYLKSILSDDDQLLAISQGHNSV